MKNELNNPACMFCYFDRTVNDCEQHCKSIKMWNETCDLNHSLQEELHQTKLALERKEREYMILEDCYAINERLNRILRNRNDRLEKALDKACGELTEIYTERNACGGLPCPVYSNVLIEHTCKHECKDRECWKEFFLNEQKG